MKKYKITPWGKKALEGRTALNKNERMDYKSMKGIVGEDVYKLGKSKLWEERKDKKNNRMVLRDARPSG